MFLIEGDGKAILYTGDIRGQPQILSSIEYIFGLTSGSGAMVDRQPSATSHSDTIHFRKEATRQAVS